MREVFTKKVWGLQNPTDHWENVLLQLLKLNSHPLAFLCYTTVSSVVRNEQILLTELFIQKPEFPDPVAAVALKIMQLSFEVSAELPTAQKHQP